MEQTAAQRANALAEAGSVKEALEVIRTAQAAGDAGAFHAEALWLIEGRFFPRDLAGARALLTKASEAGDVQSARTLSALVARGAGAAPDWPGALAILNEWAGRDEVAARQRELIARMNLDEQGNPRVDRSPSERCSSPKVVRIQELLSPDECALLIHIAEPRMTRSMIYSESEGRFVEDPVRTSDLAGFPLIFEWPFVRAVNRRIAVATGSEVECGEPLQVLRYRPSQEYRPHFDSRLGLENPRVLTAIIWLNDDYEGGETCFGEIGLKERGSTGDLLFFANTMADQGPDPRSRHAGAPVTSGTKYLASRWIRARPWRARPRPAAHGPRPS